MSVSNGIGGLQHFCPDLAIGLELGWGGLLEKVRHYQGVNLHASKFYDGLEEVILGMQGWIRRHGEDARKMAKNPPPAPSKGGESVLHRMEGTPGIQFLTDLTQTQASIEGPRAHPRRWL